MTVLCGIFGFFALKAYKFVVEKCKKAVIPFLGASGSLTFLTFFGIFY